MAGLLRRLTLRTRLLATLVILLCVVCVTVAAVSDAELYSYLLNRLDSQLAGTGSLSSQAHGRLPGAGHLPGGGAAPGGPPFVAGQAVTTLQAYISAGTVDEAGVLAGSGQTKLVPASDYPVLAALSPGAHPVTRSLAGLGRYRLVAQPTQNGQVVVTGLPLSGIDDELRQLVVIETVVIALGLLGAMLAGTAIVRLTLRPLRRVAATARQVSELPLDRGEVALAVRVSDGDLHDSTEVGQVAAALDHMLDHVAAAFAVRQASEARLRQFVADASHELRTPLASIRGYAELTRRSGRPVDPDVAHALARVESEATRMTSLVEDLLLLARLDAGRPLANEPVDLSSMVVDVLSDARAASADHRFEAAFPGEPVVVNGDGARLHQVLVNLTANARTHTPPGTLVRLSLDRRDGTAVVLVHDDGPGIPPDQLAHIFERFARGDSSRSRAAGSTGLGLAIVSAVVAAHHGTISVASVPGATTFTVTLPVEAGLTAGA